MSRLEIKLMFSLATLIGILHYKRALEVAGHRSGEGLEA